MRRFEFIPFLGFLAFLLYPMRRFDCRRCEAVVEEALGRWQAHLDHGLYAVSGPLRASPFVEGRGRSGHRQNHRTGDACGSGHRRRTGHQVRQIGKGGGCRTLSVVFVTPWQAALIVMATLAATDQVVMTRSNDDLPCGIATPGGQTNSRMESQEARISTLGAALSASPING